MKRIAKPNQLTDISSTKAPPVETPLVTDISISRLINDGLSILYREIKNLLYASSKGKLSPNDAKDLRDHLKLLFEIKDRENNFLTNLSDEELQRLLNERSSDKELPNSGSISETD